MHLRTLVWEEVHKLHQIAKGVYGIKMVNAYFRRSLWKHGKTQTKFLANPIFLKYGGAGRRELPWIIASPCCKKPVFRLLLWLLNHLFLYLSDFFESIPLSFPRQLLITWKLTVNGFFYLVYPGVRTGRKKSGWEE